MCASLTPCILIYPMSDILGLVLLMTYSLGLGLWPVYVPGLMELSCIVWLTWLKVVSI